MSLVFPPLRVGPVEWDFSRTLIFGVVNVTPDSFSDGGHYLDPKIAVAHAQKLIAEGADAVDIGGESTRPGALPVSVDEELNRVMPVISALSATCSVPISIDTTKAEVARQAIGAGATIVNDVSGLRCDPQMGKIIAAGSALAILGHMRGTPATMQQFATFRDVVHEVTDELKEMIRSAVSDGIAVSRIWIDPGIGFGKTAAHSLSLLKHTRELREAIGYPMMVGASRKSFIGAVTKQPPDQRLIGTAVATAAVITQGADAVRVHDVAQLVPAVRLADAIHRGYAGDS